MVTRLMDNWRDVGREVYELVGPESAPLGPRRIFRCGRIDFCSHSDLGHPRTILNLRKDPDPTVAVRVGPQPVS